MNYLKLLLRVLPKKLICTLAVNIIEEKITKKTDNTIDDRFIDGIKEVLMKFDLYDSKGK